MIKRGEVRWYRFSRPDKKRPVLILTRDSALEFLGEVTVAPVTSTIRDIPTEVVLRAEDGMPHECVLLTNMFCMQKMAATLKTIFYADH